MNAIFIQSIWPSVRPFSIFIENYIVLYAFFCSSQFDVCEHCDAFRMMNLCFIFNIVFFSSKVQSSKQLNRTFFPTSGHKLRSFVTYFEQKECLVAIFETICIWRNKTDAEKAGLTMSFNVNQFVFSQRPQCLRNSHWMSLDAFALCDILFLVRLESFANIWACLEGMDLWLQIFHKPNGMRIIRSILNLEFWTANILVMWAIFQ